MIAGQEHDVPSTQPRVLPFARKIDDALAFEHRVQRGQAIAGKLEGPGGSQFADAEEPALKTQRIQDLPDQLRLG